VNPIERAAQALPAALASTEQLEHLARAVYESIDTDEIARILHPGYGKPREDLPEGQPCLACKRANIVAQDIKNYLSGGNQ